MSSETRSDGTWRKALRTDHKRAFLLWQKMGFNSCYDLLNNRRCGKRWFKPRIGAKLDSFQAPESWWYMISPKAMCVWVVGVSAAQVLNPSPPTTFISHVIPGTYWLKQAWPKVRTCQFTKILEGPQTIETQKNLTLQCSICWLGHGWQWWGHPAGC